MKFLTQLSETFISAEDWENMVRKLNINFCWILTKDSRSNIKFIEEFTTNFHIIYIFKGCFEFPILCPDYFPNPNRIQENTVDGSYVKCRKENYTSIQNEPVFFVLKVMWQIIHVKFHFYYTLEKLNKFKGC